MPPLLARSSLVLRAGRDRYARVVERLRLSRRGALLVLLALATCALSAALLAGVGEDVTQHNGAATADASRLQLFVDHRPPSVISAARMLSALGAVPVLGLIAIGFAAVLWRRGQRLIVALAPGLALGASGVLVAVAKQLVGRARPDAAVRLLAENEASFPSGHAADSTALFVTLGVVVAAVLLRRPIARALSVAAGLAVSALIGLSRLVLAVHWPTDVVAGLALGLLVAVPVGTIAALLSTATPPDLTRSSRLRDRAVALLLSRRRHGAGVTFAA